MILSSELVKNINVKSYDSELFFKMKENFKFLFILSLYYGEVKINLIIMRFGVS